MIVFDAERQDGLEKLITPIVIASENPITLLTKPEASKVQGRFTATNLNQEDLYYLDSILVSTGFNNNDDYLDSKEVWVARHTPEDKPFNYEHNCKDIIGHITGCYAINASGDTISDDTKSDDIPSYYHIHTSSVLYRYWSDEELQERMDKVIAEIPEGLWFISMELLAPHFDYCLEDKGQLQIVARNKETAFMSKYLRAYGGQGVFENKRIGRLPRNFVFSGKGLVRKPANPESKILSIASENTVFQKTGYLIAAESKETKTEKKMTELEKAHSELQAEVKKLRDENTSMRAEIQESGIKQVKAELDEAKKSLEETQGELTKVKAEKEELSKSLKTAQEETTKVSETLKASQEELTKIQAENKKRDRVSMVVAAFGFESEKAEKMVAKLTKLDDEEFKEHVDSMKAEVESLKAAVTSSAEDTEQDPAEVNAKADLQNVEPTQDLTPVVASEEKTDTQKAKEDIVNFFSKESN